MNEIIKELLPVILPVVSSVLTALGAVLISIFNAKKAKKEYEAKLSEERTKNLQLEVKKVELETLLYENSFIICPNCDNKIYARDMIFYNQKKEVDKK